jgi:hypothetical protein
MFEVFGNLPFDIAGEMLYPNATLAQKRESGCSENTRHVFQAIYKNIKGEVVYRARSCVANGEYEAIPFLTALNTDVFEKFKTEFLDSRIFTACQTEACRRLMSIQYLHAVKLVLKEIDVDQGIEIGGGANSSFFRVVGLRGVGYPAPTFLAVNLAMRSLDNECIPKVGIRYSPVIPGLWYGSIEESFADSFFSVWRPDGYTIKAIETFRSRSDYLANGARHLAHLLPLIGEGLYFSAIGESAMFRSDHANSHEWRANQEERTMARCQERIDAEFNGNRDRYRCVAESRGWYARNDRRLRVRYYVNLVTATRKTPEVYGRDQFPEFVSKVIAGQLRMTQSCGNER